MKARVAMSLIDWSYNQRLLLSHNLSPVMRKARKTAAYESGGRKAYEKEVRKLRNEIMKVKRDEAKKFDNGGGYRDIIYARVHDPMRMRREQGDAQCQRLKLTDSWGHKPQVVAPTDEVEGRATAPTEEAQTMEPTPSDENMAVDDTTNRRNMKETDAGRLFRTLEWFMGCQRYPTVSSQR